MLLLEEMGTSLVINISDHIDESPTVPVLNVNLISFTLISSDCFVIGHLLMQLFSAFVSC